MAQNFTTDVTQWQGVDDEPTAGSKNLVESGGVKDDLNKIVFELDGEAQIYAPIVINKYRQDSGTESLLSGLACTAGKIDITDIKKIIFGENSIEYPISAYQVWDDSQVVNFANNLSTYAIDCESIKESYPTAKFITINIWDGSSRTELTDSDVSDFKFYNSDYANSYKRKIEDLSNSLSGEITRATKVDNKFALDLDTVFAETLEKRAVDTNFLINKYRSNAGVLQSYNGFVCTKEKVSVIPNLTIVFGENSIGYPIFSYQIWDENDTVIAFVNSYLKHSLDCSVVISSYPDSKYVTLTFWDGTTTTALTNEDISDFSLYYYSASNLEERVNYLEAETKHIKETVNDTPVIGTFEINKYRSNTGNLQNANGFVCTHDKLQIDNGISISLAENNLRYLIFSYQVWTSKDAESAIGYENFTNGRAVPSLDYSYVLGKFPTAKFITLTFWDNSRTTALTQEDINDFALYTYVEGGSLTYRVNKLESEILPGYLFGKKIVTLCDSMGAASQWQVKLANLTGALYNKSLNDGNYSFGGTRTLDANQDGNDGQSRAKKLVDDALIVPDIIIYECVNDVNGNSGIGTSLDEPFFRMSQNKLSLGTLPEDKSSAIDYWNNNLATIVSSYTPAAGTIIGVPYSTNKTVRLTITGTPTNSGNLKITVSTETKYIAVSAGESISSIIDKILECSWLNYIDEEDTQVNNSVLFSLVYGSSPSLVVDDNGTGVTSLVTTNVEGILYYWKYFYGHDLSKWTESSYWKDALSKWSQWKGVIEFLQTSFKSAQIFWLLPATYDFVQDPLASGALYPDGSVNYMYLYEHGCEYNDLYEQQKDFCEKYQIHLIDLPNLAGINPMNASYFCNSGNVHPKQVAYDRWAEIIAQQIN